MNRRHEESKRPNTDPASPDWLDEGLANKHQALTSAELEELVDGIRRGIEDTAAWQDLVTRYGEREAERILKLAVYGQHQITGDSDN